MIIGTTTLNEVSVCNEALGQIGQPPITDIQGTSTTTNWCLTFYDALRRALLRAHHWNFAILRVQLLATTAPVSEYAFAYALPEDCLKVTDYAGASPSTSSGLWWPGKPVAPYKIEGRTLASNDGQAWIVYLADVTDVSQWDPLFYQFLAKLLAAKLAVAIMKDFKMSFALKKEAYDLDFAIAAAVDGQEGSVEAHVTDDLQWGRWHA